MISPSASMADTRLPSHLKSTYFFIDQYADRGESCLDVWTDVGYKR